MKIKNVLAEWSWIQLSCTVLVKIPIMYIIPIRQLRFAYALVLVEKWLMNCARITASKQTIATVTLSFLDKVSYSDVLTVGIWELLPTILESVD